MLSRLKLVNIILDTSNRIKRKFFESNVYWVKLLEYGEKMPFLQNEKSLYDSTKLGKELYTILEKLENSIMRFK